MIGLFLIENYQDLAWSTDCIDHHCCEFMEGHTDKKQSEKEPFRLDSDSVHPD